MPQNKYALARYYLIDKLLRRQNYVKTIDIVENCKKELGCNISQRTIQMDIDAMKNGYVIAGWYICSATHERLQKAVFTFRDRYVTAISLVDAILAHHFESNEELLSRLYNEEVDKILSFRKYNNKPDSIDEEIPPSTVDGDDETVCP